MIRQKTATGYLWSQDSIYRVPNNLFVLHKPSAFMLRNAKLLLDKKTAWLQFTCHLTRVMTPTKCNNLVEFLEMGEIRSSEISEDLVVWYSNAKTQKMKLLMLTVAYTYLLSSVQNTELLSGRNWISDFIFKKLGSYYTFIITVIYLFLHLRMPSEKPFW